jgi:hypothetical protein
VHAKEGGNVELKIIINHNLGDGIRPIVEWKNILMGSCKSFFLQVKSNFIYHLKLVWHLVLIMVFLVLGNGLLQNILNMLADVLDLFNEPGVFVGFGLRMGRFFLCVRKRYYNIHGTQWLKSQPHLKGVVSS